MADSILSLSSASTRNSASIGAAKAGQEVQKAVIERLLGSVEQAGQAALQAPANRVDRVQISDQARQLLNAEQAQQS